MLRYKTLSNLHEFVNHSAEFKYFMTEIKPVALLSVSIISNLDLKAKFEKVSEKYLKITKYGD